MNQSTPDMNFQPASAKHLILILLLAVCNLTAQAQQRISGTVTDSLGNPINKVYVIEMDKEHRILNQTTTDRRGNFVMSVRDTLTGYLRFTAGGYDMHRDRIRRNLQRFSIQLAEHKASRLSVIRQKDNGQKPRYVVTSKLLCGRIGVHEEPWTVSLERLNDSLYVLQMPVKADNPAGLYKEGRSVTFLDMNDYQLTMAYNGEDALPVAGYPNEDGVWNTKDMQRIGNFKLQSQRESIDREQNLPIYFYPQFILTREDLQILTNQADRLRLVAVDNEAGNNFWQVYPMDGFAKELRKILGKLDK